MCDFECLSRIITSVQSVPHENLAFKLLKNVTKGNISVSRCKQICISVSCSKNNIEAKHYQINADLELQKEKPCCYTFFVADFPVSCC